MVQNRSKSSASERCAGVIVVDDIAPLKNNSLFVDHCSYSTLGCGSLGACSRHDSSSSVPDRSLNNAVARSCCRGDLGHDTSFDNASRITQRRQAATRTDEMSNCPYLVSKYYKLGMRIHMYTHQIKRNGGNDQARRVQHHETVGTRHTGDTQMEPEDQKPQVKLASNGVEAVIIHEETTEYTDESFCQTCQPRIRYRPTDDSGGRKCVLLTGLPCERCWSRLHDTELSEQGTRWK